MDRNSFIRLSHEMSYDSTFQTQEVSSNSSYKLLNENKEGQQSTQLETKASSHISAGTHETSFDFSESSFQNEIIRADDYFREEFILQRKIGKKQFTLRQDCFTPEFLTHITQQLTKFSQHAHANSFQNFLHFIIKPNQTIFIGHEIKINNTKGQLFTLREAMEMLIVQGKNQFFIHTFDLVACHLTFFILLILYWIQPKLCLTYANGEEIRRKGKVDQSRVKKNITAIVKTYIQTHSQEINENQVLFLLAMYFLDTLKQFNENEVQIMCQIQRTLVRDVQTFRKIQKMEKSFSKSNNDTSFETKLHIFEEKHSFINASDTTYHMLISHILQSFSSTALQKFYLADGNTQFREEYQLKKDTFCLWVLNNMIRQDQKRGSTVLQDCAMYIIKIMGMLKKMKQINNIEGMSYLIPILANLKTLLPKAWRHVAKRRPEIQTKFNQYSDFMLQHRFRVDVLGEDSTPWGQTIFLMTQKMLKHSKCRQGIDLEQHKNYYNSFLAHLMHLRQRSKRQITQLRFQLVLQNEMEVGFNVALIENFLAKKYSKQGLAEAWNQFTDRANQINANMTESLLADIIDYCFIGSTQKYFQVDL